MNTNIFTYDEIKAATAVDYELHELHHYWSVEDASAFLFLVYLQSAGSYKEVLTFRRSDRTLISAYPETGRCRLSRLIQGYPANRIYYLREDVEIYDTAEGFVQFMMQMIDYVL